MATQPNTQTELKRKATARKGQATRHRNAADRDGSFADAARVRTRAETNRLKAASFEAGRAFHASLGAAVTARDTVAGAVRPLGDPGRVVSRLREDAAQTFTRLERRGERTRKRAQRGIERFGRRARREARETVPG
jgi:hypothetical protein